MGLFSRKIEKQIASYQQELIETHYREVDNMYRQIRGWRHDYRNHIHSGWSASLLPMKCSAP